MYVLLNWIDTDKVLHWYDNKLAERNPDSDDQNSIDVDEAEFDAYIKTASPELQVLLRNLDDPFKLLAEYKKKDVFNYSLMAVRFFVHGNDLSTRKAVKFSLASRFPGAPESKPPVSLACKGFLDSNLLSGFFTQYQRPRPSANLTFVSFKSAETDECDTFFKRLVLACAALDSPISGADQVFSCFNRISLCENESFELVKAYTHNNRSKLEHAGTLANYESLLSSYVPGVSVESASALLIYAAEIKGIIQRNI